MNIYEVISGYLEEGKTGIMATVIKRKGSAPRKVGAKMFVGAEGKTYGTIGGGRLEALAREEALTIIDQGITRILTVKMEARNVEEGSMLCGGNVEVLLEPVAPKHREMYQQIKTSVEAGEPGIIITCFGLDGFAKMFMKADRTALGDRPAEDAVNKYFKFLYAEDPVVLYDVLVEPMPRVAQLYILGAGHVAQFVSKIAKMVGFRVTVIDDREEFANGQRFPEADEIKCGDFIEALNCFAFTGNEYIVIMTRDHAQDAEVLEASIRKSAKYIGMIGSRKKVETVKDSLRQRGYDENKLRGIHAPIGISIQAETPEEIAVSIMAELIAARNRA